MIAEAEVEAFAPAGKEALMGAFVLLVFHDESLQLVRQQLRQRDTPLDREMAGAAHNFD